MNSHAYNSCKNPENKFCIFSSFSDKREYSYFIIHSEIGCDKDLNDILNISRTFDEDILFDNPDFRIASSNRTTSEDKPNVAAAST